ncbi:unnamed protein product, partial [Didymodactylos carnosus]
MIDFPSDTFEQFEDFMQLTDLSEISCDLACLSNMDDLQKVEEKQQTQQQMICCVCGDKAIGFNFGQITCESCKAFFRRNALRCNPYLKCRFSGSCKIDIFTRRHCTYCRLKKCFQMKMNKEYIRTKNENELRKLETKENKRLKEIREILKSKMICTLNILNNDVSLLTQDDHCRIKNIITCHERATKPEALDPYSVLNSSTTVPKLDNVECSIYMAFCSFFENMPEFHELHINDQMKLIKCNIRTLMPLNFLLLSSFNVQSALEDIILTIPDDEFHRKMTNFNTKCSIFVHNSTTIKLLLIILILSTSLLTTDNMKSILT